MNRMAIGHDADELVGKQPHQPEQIEAHAEQPPPYDGRHGQTGCGRNSSPRVQAANAATIAIHATVTIRSSANSRTGLAAKMQHKAIKALVALPCFGPMPDG
jgi:hypothetical protein